MSRFPILRAAGFAGAASLAFAHPAQATPILQAQVAIGSLHALWRAPATLPDPEVIASLSRQDTPTAARRSPAPVR